MPTLDLIARLIAARRANDPDAVARALIALEARMLPDAIADLLSALDGAPPAPAEPPAAPYLQVAAA